MKITANVIDSFEYDQRHFGTQVAIRNLLWLKATGTLHDIGVRRVTTIDKGASRDKAKNSNRVRKAVNSESSRRTTGNRLTGAGSRKRSR